MTSSKGTEGKREFYFISALSGSISTSQDTWVIDSGASKHMTSFKNTLIDLPERNISAQVELGNDAKYAVKGIPGSTSFKLNSGETLRMDNILYVLELKKNLIFVSAIEDEGYVLRFYYSLLLLIPKAI